MEDGSLHVYNLHTLSEELSKVRTAKKGLVMLIYIDSGVMKFRYLNYLCTVYPLCMYCKYFVWRERETEREREREREREERERERRVSIFIHI